MIESQYRPNAGRMVESTTSMNDDAAEEPEPLGECVQCHAQVPERQLVRMNGKQLCYGCVAIWFDDDDEDEDADR